MAGSTARAGLPDPVLPMLAVDGELPAAGYGYEIKWDGFRACLQIAAHGDVRVTSRLGNDVTRTYPDVAEAITSALAGQAGVLDGELVVLDESGRPDFGRIQTRHQRGPNSTLLRTNPVTFFAFDLLHLGGETLLQAPYEQRRAALADLDLGDNPRITVPPYYTDRDVTPADLLDVVEQQQLEGVVAKRLDSPYQPGKRSRYWIKHALIKTQEVVIGGWKPGEGRRNGMIGSLLLGAHDHDGQLVYIGHVGTGFTERALEDLQRRLEPLHRATSPFDTVVPRDRARHARWVEPLIVGEVVYRKLTDNRNSERRLRHAAWRGLRPDKEPREAKVPPLH
ncbi:bifunctional non-homologous end joining protein LigD [Amycolatopsis marina]|uniref:DNA ligase (ATP) n=1 Tax=Amycolatopsis marina TaxID=490629 RepID=A0A1I1ASU8_9PSEU|nr:non-homologous end-joining DNA ligase [Amycolatopsis marina]SFB41094.1 bifunctional non-homologous end joining protein LigD [Amycolatopsis marina]